MSFFLLNRDFVPEIQSLITRRQNNVSTLACYLLVAVFSVFYYLIFHGPANLHDVSHYLVSGVAMARDHANFIYPYSSMNPEGGGSAYGYFQENSQLIDVTKSYPSKLYSSVFSLWYLMFGTMRFYSAHLLSIGVIVVSNMLLFAIARRFFVGLKQFLFIISVAFTPVVITAVYPGNDTFAYFSSILVLWCCFCTRLSPLSIGLLIGALSHFRSQIIFFLFVLPALLVWVSERKSWPKILIGSVTGVIISYLVIGMLLKLPINSTDVSGGGLEFYIRFFLTSFYGLGDIRIVIDQFIHNVVNLSDKNYLYIFLFTGVLGLFANNVKLSQGLSFCALVIVVFPLCIFSLDRYSAPHARYYVGAIPFLVLSWFLFLECRGWVKSNVLAVFTTVLVVSAWYSINGFPLSNASSISAIKSRVEFLDFAGADTVLRENFNESDLLITNNSLPSGLSKLRNFIPYPTYQEFKNGDNREIDGLVFVYADKGVNDFFKPVDWMVNGSLPDEIRDGAGTTFKRVFYQTSHLDPDFTRPEDEAKFVLYKNVDSSRVKKFDSLGRRVYSVNYHDELNVPVTKSPFFDDSKFWSGHPHLLKDSLGVEVGPGADNSNILSQRFSTKAGDVLKVQAVALNSRKRSGKGRLQINWIDQQGQFINTSISIFNATSEPKKYNKIFVAPSNAAEGIVYVTPHDKDSVLKFISMEVLRASQDD
ncbi:hypothetical protein LOY70_08705 [Pseudomonas sp. B21-054]|uniref:hypothetical protein n=1 Tax=Pseudomonas sp. B21-054 TaxID=2895494 RepID=UPI002231893B|nr:hypothetical protein [Pseudomonas sp. B21-054]UZE19662.1 hypothetical protein LOY70_08705 [Pseudomonas sp. B21-054]